MRLLTGQGLTARVLATAIEPFGPVMSRRAALLEDLGLIRPGQRHEELVVIAARRLASGAGRLPGPVAERHLGRVALPALDSA